MKYFDKDFWKFAGQFFLVILFVLITLSLLSGYLSITGGEANIMGN
ncbi:MAG TPA: hypothetical protein P5056_02440 [Candidatus Paceibacterota bacterium]|nr:hypothetical protein [Candidatus Paceibacterota bacterium]